MTAAMDWIDVRSVPPPQRRLLIVGTLRLRIAGVAAGAPRGVGGGCNGG